MAHSPLLALATFASERRRTSALVVELLQMNDTEELQRRVAAIARRALILHITDIAAISEPISRTLLVMQCARSALPRLLFVVVRHYV